MAQPWFKMWAGDYLSDPDIVLLSYEKRGMLLQLWAYAWKAGGIPADLGEQGMLLGLAEKVMRTHSGWIAKFFRPHPADPSKLISPRMELERQEAEAKGMKASESAMLRWTKRNPNAHANASPNASPNAVSEPLRNGCETDAVRSQMSEKEQPLPPSGPGDPSAVADDGGAVVRDPEPKPPKPKPKPKNQNFAIAALEMRPEEESAFERLWGGYPAKGWDFRSNTAQPRRINRAKASARWVDLCRNVKLETEGGRPLGPDDLADAVLAWVARKREEMRKQYGPAMANSPCVPCLHNLLSAEPTSKKHWQEALIEFFGVEEAS